MKYLTVTQAADQSGLSVALIRRACANGSLPAERYGRSWLIEPTALTAWMTDPEAHKIGRPRKS